MKSYTYYYTEDYDQSSFSFWTNWTHASSMNNDDFTSNYVAPQDVSVDAVLTSIYLNSVAFVVLMCMYEILRRLLPSVYSSEVKRQYKLNIRRKDPNVSQSAGGKGGGLGGPGGLGGDTTTIHVGNNNNGNNNSTVVTTANKNNNDKSCDDDTTDDNVSQANSQASSDESLSSSAQFLHNQRSFASIRNYGSLPEVISQNWISDVLSISWETIRKHCGLDGYFFLRYIRMNLRICAVTCFWAWITLVPTYATGANAGQIGWYHLSVANVLRGSWRMWIPALFAYLFTGFIFFVMKQEYRHFLELRMEFLARGTSYIHPQHHYSLMIENIPHELRSEKAMYDYFDQLFPGKVHSVSIVLNIPDLEAVRARCMRVCRRLEKSIAYYHATGKRATHNVGSPRISVLGIDMAPCDCYGGCCGTPNVAYVDNREALTHRPERGTHVDSISYYTYDLAETNKQLHTMQQRKVEMAFEGSNHVEADNWFTKLVVSAYEMADEIMIDSAEDNALRTTYSGVTAIPEGSAIPQAELMSTHTLYGSMGVGETPRTAQCSPYTSQKHHLTYRNDKALQSSSSDENNDLGKRSSEEELLEQAKIRRSKRLIAPGTSFHAHMIRRVVGRLGLDFFVAGLKFFNHQLDHATDGVIGSTMSSTGFVSFLDLTSVACAASTPLTSKPQVLDVGVAPEPRDIIWQNAHISLKSQDRRENITNILLVIGGFLWIFPLTAIQAFSKADYIAQIPGMEWILTANGGKVSQFVNGYLPVIALLCLIMILPVIFEVVARNFERRKTTSDVQNSMLGRYFYYQILNLYISVTAGSLWKSLAEILDHPSSILQLLGESLPFMVGYFVALLVTKILAGLPMVFLRIGALSKILIRRTVSRPAKLTQRELDEIYRSENVQYGWEYPSILFVTCIYFTYAIICPVILPVGMIYFGFALTVYKKQILYVYQPVYESGGAMFPGALQKTLFGLVGAQLTLMGYLSTRGSFLQVTFLLPLPIATLWGMGYFNVHYAKPSQTLSMERAREYDRVSEWLARNKASARSINSDGDAGDAGETSYGIEGRRKQFDKNSYRQPVLTERPLRPKNYRRGQRDTVSEDVRTKLRELHDYSLMSDQMSSTTSPFDRKTVHADESHGHVI